MLLSTKKFVLLFFCMTFASAFLFAQDMSGLKGEIEKIDKACEAAMLTNNPDSYISFLTNYYTDDAISLPSYQPMVKGIEAIKKAVQAEDNMGMKMTAFDLTTTDIFESGDLVYEIGTYTLTLQMEGAPDPINDYGKYLTIYEKQDDGSLKIKLDTWNTDMNPWQNMEMPGMEEKSMEGNDKN